MKKIVSLALLLSLIFSVTACGQTVQTETDAAGNIETSKAAERAQESGEAAPTESAATDAEKEAIMIAEFDFETDPSARPAIAGKVENMEEYDTIILGYPIWHGQAPRIISTFLESYDFLEKTIIPFCTSHSSGIGSSADNLHELCPDSVNWMEGKRFEARTMKETMENWLENVRVK